MAAAAASAASDGGDTAIGIAGYRYVNGMDPGPVNHGWTVYDLHTKKFVHLETVQFRAPGTGSDDLGHARLISLVAQWIRANASNKYFQEGVISMENQPPEGHGREAQAVQHAFQAFFGHRCVPVQPGAVKARFAEAFPRHPEYKNLEPRTRQATQYRYDKKNAVDNGRKLIPKEILEKYEEENPKEDDAFDAAWLALYLANVRLSEIGHLLATPVPPRRRKRREVHPRGRPSPKAKSATKPKPKAKAKSAAKPKRAAASAAQNPDITILSSSSNNSDSSDDSSDGDFAPSPSPLKRARV